MIEQAKFTYSPLGKAFEKQTKTIEEQGKKQIQAHDSIMCGYFSIGFINFMLKGKSLFDYTNLFSPNDYEKNDQY